MAPISFTFCPVESFPNAETFHVPYQWVLDNTEENADTHFALSIRDFFRHFDRWIVYHEMKVTAFGKVYGRTFRHYVEPHEFPMYLSRDRRLLILREKREVAHNFVDVINKNLGGFSIGRYTFDIKAMLQYLPPITSVWVGGLGDQYVKTAGYFGQHVDRSDELQAKLRIGQISALRVQYSLGPDNEEISAGINTKGGIVLYSRFDVEEHALQTAIDIFEKYVLPTNPREEFPQNPEPNSSPQPSGASRQIPTGQLQFPD